MGRLARSAGAASRTLSLASRSSLRMEAVTLSGPFEVPEWTVSLQLCRIAPARALPSTASSTASVWVLCPAAARQLPARLAQLPAHFPEMAGVLLLPRGPIVYLASLPNWYIPLSSKHHL